VSRDAKLLADGESIVIDTRPHAKALTGPVLVLLATAGLGGFVAGRVPEGDLQAAGRAGVAVLAALVLLRGAVLPFLRWRATRVVVTDRRVLTRSGLVSRTGRDLPLSRVDDLAFSRSPVDRLFGSGTVVLSPAGERPPLVLRAVPQVAVLQRRLSELVETAD
jgi:membrane protein YdbS with pleckstrin-like domain